MLILRKARVKSRKPVPNHFIQGLKSGIHPTKRDLILLTPVFKDLLKELDR
jgi:hypothetical protein